MSSSTRAQASPSAPVRFQFDVEFEPTNLDAAVANRRREDARAREEAAFARGQASAEAEAARKVAEAAQRLAKDAAALSASLADERARLLEEALEVAMASARKLSLRLDEIAPESETLAFVRRCLALLRDEPRLVVTVSEEARAGLAEPIAAEARRQGAGERLVVRAEPGAASRVAIEWGRGHAEFDPEAVQAAVDAEVTAFLGRLRGTSETD